MPLSQSEEPPTTTSSPHSPAMTVTVALTTMATSSSPHIDDSSCECDTVEQLAPCSDDQGVSGCDASASILNRGVRVSVNDSSLSIVPHADEPESPSLSPATASLLDTNTPSLSSPHQVLSTLDNPASEASCHEHDDPVLFDPPSSPLEIPPLHLLPLLDLSPSDHAYHEIPSPGEHSRREISPPPLPPRRTHTPSSHPTPNLSASHRSRSQVNMSPPLPLNDNQCSAGRGNGARPKSILNKLGELLKTRRGVDRGGGGNKSGGGEVGGAQLAYFLESVGDDPPPVPPPRLQHTRANSTDFTQSLRELRHYGWYWGPLSWEEAEKKLQSTPEGSFLVRDSADDRHILALSFSFENRVRHVRIEHSKGKFSFGDLTDTLGCTTVVEFVEKAMEMSNNGRHLFFLRSYNPGAPPLQVRLLYPISRLMKMCSLRHICRFEILKCVRADHIDLLPLPTTLKYYLQETQYYVEDNDIL